MADDTVDPPRRRHSDFQEGEREGAWRTRVNMTIDAHEARLNRINGSIDRTGDRLGALSEQIDALLAEQRTSRAVGEALRDELNDRATKRLTAKQTFWAALGTVLTLIATIAAVLTLLSGFGVL